MIPVYGGSSSSEAGPVSSSGLPSYPYPSSYGTGIGSSVGPVSSSGLPPYGTGYSSSVIPVGTGSSIPYPYSSYASSFSSVAGPASSSGMSLTTTTYKTHCTKEHTITSGDTTITTTIETTSMVTETISVPASSSAGPVSSSLPPCKSPSTYLALQPPLSAQFLNERTVLIYISSSQTHTHRALASPSQPAVLAQATTHLAPAIPHTRSSQLGQATAAAPDPSAAVAFHHTHQSTAPQASLARRHLLGFQSAPAT